MSLDVSRLVADVLASTPLPESPDTLDRSTRRRLDAVAARRGLAPAAALAAIRAEQAAAAEAYAEADAIALEARR